MTRDASRAFDAPLTPEQQWATEQRILSDASLLREGASINEFGRLVVTGLQRQQLAAESLHGEARKAWLQVSVTELVPGPSGLATGLINALLREGYVTRRDVLVGGKAKVERIRSVGEGRMALLEQALHQNDFDIQWHAQPTVEDIAGLCDDLASVSSVGLSHGPVCTRLTSLEGTSYAGRPYTLSVQDILDETHGNFVVSPYSMRPDSLLRDIYSCAAEAEVFAYQFRMVQRAP